MIYFCLQRCTKRFIIATRWTWFIIRIRAVWVPRTKSPGCGITSTVWSKNFRIWFSFTKVLWTGGISTKYYSCLCSNKQWRLCWKNSLCNWLGSTIWRWVLFSLTFYVSNYAIPQKTTSFGSKNLFYIQNLMAFFRWTFAKRTARSISSCHQQHSLRANVSKCGVYWTHTQHFYLCWMEERWIRLLWR